MCGIMGFYRLGKSKHNLIQENIELAFEETSGRGKQATGFYTPESGVIKDGVSAAIFMKKFEKEFAYACKSDIFIGHCRAATTGFDSLSSTASKNENNHPHESEHFVLVHNGHFSHLPRIKGYKYNGNCDSELAVSYIETFGPKQAISLMSKEDGFSLVFLDKRNNHMFFYRESNPLVFSYDTFTKYMLFGSTSEIVHTMADVSEELTGLGLNIPSDTGAWSTNTNTLYEISEKGVIAREDIKLIKDNEEFKKLPKSITNKVHLEDIKEPAWMKRYGDTIGSGFRERRYEDSAVFYDGKEKSTKKGLVEVDFPLILIDGTEFKIFPPLANIVDRFARPQTTHIFN